MTPSSNTRSTTVPSSRTILPRRSFLTVAWVMKMIIDEDPGNDPDNPDADELIVNYLILRNALEPLDIRDDDGDDKVHLNIYTYIFDHGD